MANLSTYSKNALVQWLDGKADMPAAATVYLALFNGDPSGAGTEVTTTVCSGRLAISSAMGTSSGGAGSATHAADLVFTTSALAAATVNYVAAYDAATNGNLLWYRSVTSNAVAIGNTVKINAGVLIVTAGGDLTSTYTKDYLVNWMTGKASFPAKTDRYMALFNGDPQGAGAEVTGTIRPAGRIDFTSLMADASSGSAANTSIINYGSAAAGATVSHTAAFDDASAGHLLCSHALTGGTQNITTGNPVYIPIGGHVTAAA